jgi:N-glycosylase/DNA lyase
MVATLARYGPKIETPLDETVHAFPRSDRIAAIPEAELRAAGFGYRGATIPKAARQVMAHGGDDWIFSLKQATYDQAFEALMGVSGIGPKLADCICLYSLDHTEAVPVDTHVYQAATRIWFPEWRGQPLNARRYREIGDRLRSRLGRLAAYAQQLMFVDNLDRNRAERAL